MNIQEAKTEICNTLRAVTRTNSNTISALQDWGEMLK